MASPQGRIPMPLTLENCPSCNGTGLRRVYVWTDTGTSDPPSVIGKPYDVPCYCSDGKVLRLARG